MLDIASVWLIGRSYAAAIERRKNAEETSDDFYEITVVEKIKKSNFRPDLFFIYDSRAKGAITKITPRLNEIKDITAEDADSKYNMFCRRSQYLRDSISEHFGKNLTPRQIDKILLRTTDKIIKARTKHSSRPGIASD